MKIEICPLCGQQPMKVIYYGLPHYLCTNTECNCLWGFFSVFTQYLPFNGVFIQYQGNYWTSLWHWLRGNFTGEE